MTQVDEVLLCLKDKGTIRPLEAWVRFGCYRLSDVIYKLRKKHNIGTRTIPYKRPDGKIIQFAEYVYLGEKR